MEAFQCRKDIQQLGSFAAVAEYEYDVPVRHDPKITVQRIDGA
jgi:hypothetical protein